MILIKILVCGSYGGAFQVKLCHRLKKEKHEVFVLSNDSIEEKKNSSVFQEYRFAYDNESVMNVMTSISPDVVVFCGALDASYNWHMGVTESVDYVAGVVNVLTCARAVNTKKFLYLSSLSVFSGNTEKKITEAVAPVPITRQEQTILQGERLCLSTSGNTEDTKISVVRMPQVYGVCEKKTEQCVCNEIADATCNDKITERNQNAEEYLMYLDDALDAVYKVITVEQKEVRKVYHIVPQAGVKQEAIAEYFTKLLKGEIEPSIEKTDEKVRFTFTTQKELGFSEKYSLEEGLATYFKQYIELPKEKVKKDIKEQQREKRSIFRPILETVLIFILVQLFISFTADAAFHSVIDVYLIYVLAVAVVLGVLPSTIAVVLCIIGKYSMLFLSNHTVSIFTEYTNYLWILQIFSLSVLVGYIKDWYSKSVDEMKRENVFLKEDVASLKAINDSNVEVKAVFEKRLVNYKDSYAKVYEIVSQLDDLESKSILFKAAKVVANVMESKDVAVYTCEGNGGFCRLMASTSELARQKGKSLLMKDYPEVLERLNNKKIYMNRKFEENMPMFAAGTYNGDALEVVIMVWSMELENVSLHQSNLLNMLTKMMERSTGRALRYMESVKSSTYIAGTNVMESAAFCNMLDIYCAGESEGVLEFSVLEVLSYQGDEENLYGSLSHLIRGTDYLGLDTAGKIYILLTNSNETESAWVMKRCDERNITTRILNKNTGKTAEEVFSNYTFR